MADSTIEWTKKTWNPTTGCTSVGKECDHCYALKMTNRHVHNKHQKKYSGGFNDVKPHELSLNEPHKWANPEVVFVNSMSDLFHQDIPLSFIQKVFNVMNETPHHTYQVLTKRDHLLKRFSDDLNWTDNIWMGVSVGTQKATSRIDKLRECGAKHKFLSVEPLIEEITDMDLTGIDWVIVGGESGSNQVRPMDKKWVMRVQEICANYNVPFFFKQWGMKRNNPDPNDPTIDKNHKFKAKGGCMLNGNLYLENPCVKNVSVKTIQLFGAEYIILDETSDLNTIWELKSYLPMMEDNLFAQLKDDIKKNGVNDPVLYWVTPEGKKLVIEGHTRLNAAISAQKKDIPTKEIKGDFKSLDDIKLWMVKHQFQRRNLSGIERIELAFHSKETIEKLAKANLSKAGKGQSVEESIDTYDEIANLAGVGRASVVRYSSVISKASETVKKKMSSGELSINAAYKTVKEEQPEKKAPKPESVEPKPIMANNLDRAMQMLSDDKVEAVLIIKDKAYIDSLSKQQKKKFAFFKMKDTN